MIMVSHRSEWRNQELEVFADMLWIADACDKVLQSAALKAACEARGITHFLGWAQSRASASKSLRGKEPGPQCHSSGHIYAAIKPEGMHEYRVPV